MADLDDEKFERNERVVEVDTEHMEEFTKKAFDHFKSQGFKTDYALAIVAFTTAQLLINRFGTDPDILRLNAGEQTKMVLELASFVIKNMADPKQLERPKTSLN